MPIKIHDQIQWSSAQKLKTHLLRIQSWKVLPFKPGAGPYIAMHATPTARDFFLANFYPSGPFPAFFQTTPKFFSCVGCGWHRFLRWPQKTSHPAKRYRHVVQVPVLSARGIWIGSKTCVTVFLGSCSEIVDTVLSVVLEKETCGIMTREMNNLETDGNLSSALM